MVSVNTILLSLAFIITTVTAKSLLVTDTPTTVRPYVLPYLTGTVYGAGPLAYRFPVTSLSSVGTFTLLTTNTDGSDSLSVFPHTHQARYENFFCTRGATQLWFGDSNGTQNVRALTADDYGASPPNTTHTFQTLQPDTEMVGVVFPGGLENLFYAVLPDNTTYATSTPYNPGPFNFPTGPPPGAINYTALEVFDIYYQPNFTPRRDILNGTAPTNSGWHTITNTLPADATTPFYVAKDFGPKYLSSKYGYQAIDTLNTPIQSGSHDFTLSYITPAKRADDTDTTVPWHKHPSHAALRLTKGSLLLKIQGYDRVRLFEGDVAFIPGNTTWRYHSDVAYTKFLYAGAGHSGLDVELLVDAVPWQSPTWPIQ